MCENLKTEVFCELIKFSNSTKKLNNYRVFCLYIWSAFTFMLQIHLLWFSSFCMYFLSLALYIYELKTMSYRRQQLLHRASSTHSPCVSSPCVNLN